MQADSTLLQYVLVHGQRALAEVQSVVDSALSSQKAQELLQVAMQQWLAAASCAACLALLLTTVAAGWLALWHTTMKDVGFFREVMGLNKPRPDVKAARQAEMAAEIERIKRQHSRSSARSLHARPHSMRPS